MAVTGQYTDSEDPPSEVPEPATWAFMTGGGLLLLDSALIGRRTR